jgi:CubicO group peptidase (beta-lactamase class C family)
MSKKFCAVIALWFCLSFVVFAQAPAANNNLAATFDADLAKMFKANEPGAAAIVVKDGQVIFRKGYGMAHLELGVANAPDHIFRIGSITKQFTAVSILMLMEQGKLALTDEITKFLPDYPTQTLAQGRKITIEHLLTHTSGIVSYTGLPEWRVQWRKDLTMAELIDLFKNKPMEFAPGESYKYNNSAFVLLGAIIEKVSGMKYGEFVEQKIFTPLGMTSSFYDNTQRIIPRRAAGYDRNGANYVNAEYLSMSHPHAAGALMSTVDDLAKWDAALYTEKLVKQDSLKRAWTSYVLASGKPTDYGYGWGVAKLEGMQMLAHGGGIHGFTCDAVRLPETRVYVAILTNRGGGTGNLARKFAVLASGKEWHEPKPPETKPVVTVSETVLERYVGEYQLAPTFSITITREGAKLFGQATGQQRFELMPESETKFNIAIVSAQIEFTVEDGNATQLTFYQGGRTMPAKKIK